MSFVFCFNLIVLAKTWNFREEKKVTNGAEGEKFEIKKGGVFLVDQTLSFFTQASGDFYENPCAKAQP